ncbi:MAG: plasmid pRiA4b ORF-3 family protein [Oscillospiraceae bacterium]|jgi:hypothetical protein|nr:plasmid pRiA4b ORF-3 family protein [Oscillospiraceae bacterium]
MAKQKIYQFYAELNDFKPKIWRRFQVSADTKISKFAYIVMIMFRMRALHLFCIEHNGPILTPKGRKSNRLKLLDRYELPNEYSLDENGSKDATSSTISQFAFNENAFLVLWYDFGDDWFVTIKLEEIIEDNQSLKSDFPKILEGKCYGIVDDCGGVWGLEDLVEAFKQKSGDLYDDLSDWLETEDFDIKKFDLPEMNLHIKNIPKIYEKIYEKRLNLTRKEVSLISLF